MPNNPFKQLEDWSHSPLGKAFLQREMAMLSSILSKQRGRFLVWCSSIQNSSLSTISGSFQPIVLTKDSYQKLEKGLVIWTETTENLPIADESVDLLVLQHCLEFAEPSEILREAQRILVPEGTLIICNFNPWSLWGLWHLAHAWSPNPPWQGHLLSTHRLKEWLMLLNFQELTTRSFFYHPPVQHEAFLQKYNSLQKLEEFTWLNMGCGVIIQAKKRTFKPVSLRSRMEIAQKIVSLRA